MSLSAQATPATIASALREAAAALSGASPTPRVDAQVLLMHACRLSRTALVLNAGRRVTPAERRRLGELLARRRHGEPVAYLTGRREFWSLEFRVTPATLIPRPETELLVERALAALPAAGAATVADLGTGCGAVALAIARERPSWRLIAVDRAADALAVARHNAAAFGLRNVEFRRGDWCRALAGERVDLLVSNPPYLRAGDRHRRHGDLRFEPRAALVAGRDGLAAIRRIAAETRDCLRARGRVLLEHGFDQGPAVREILRRGGYRDIAVFEDLAGHERVTTGRR